MTRVRQSILGGATLVMIAGVGALLYSRPLAAQSAPASASRITFTTLPGFTIERVVPPAKTDSYVVMTFDSLGRLVVSKEQDHPRLLLDADGDGIYESEKVISDKVKNCQGLWFDGRTLYGDCAPAVPPAGTPASGPNSQVSGLYKMADTNGDDVADTFETLSGYVGGIQEHGPHAIRRGPDGEMTVMTGNNTFVPDDKIDPMSPLRGSKESQFLPALPDGRGFGPSVKEGLHGVISRFDRQTGLFSLQVGGLRNAYDHAFNLDGELFTFDSDMEWDINLPWYRDVRSVHGIPGGNYGYRNGSGKFPAYYIDSLPPVRDLGRGSPVGVEFYQHTVYPAQFHDAYFEADWSRGRLLWTPLKRNGATYAAVEEKAEFVHGEPLNITDVETGPDGLIYFTTGGRGTEGGVYRVRYGAGGGAAATGATKPTGVRPPATALEAARQPHPLSSWGYAALEQAKTAMGNAWGTDLETLARDGAAKAEDRAQAIYLLQRHGPKPNAALLKALTGDSQATVRAAAVFVVGLHGSDNAKAIAAAALKDSDPFVQRRAAEAVVRMGLAADKPSFAPVADIFALLNSPDRFVRWAGRLALTRTPRAEWRDLAQQETNPLGAIEGMVALVDTASSDADVEPVVKKQLSMLAQTNLSVDDRLRLLRAFELSAIALKTPSAALRKQVHDLAIAQFPAQDERVNRQLALVLAWAGQPAAIAKILAAMPKGDDRPQLQLHYVYALRTMQTGWTAAQKTQLIDWYAKAASWRGGASFPGFINLLFDASLQTFTDAQKKLAYQKVPQFAPLTEAELAEAAKRTAAMRAAAAQAQAQAAPQGGGSQAANANRPATPPPAQAGPPRPGQSPANARARGVAAISREEILQEQIFTPLRTPPSLTVGRATYDRACGACHRFGGIGTDVGPDLTTLNSRFQKKDVLEAILWPSRVISEQYEMTMVETKDGKAYGGFVVQEDAQKVTLRTADAVGRRIEVPVAQIKSRQKSPVSLMPEALIDDMSQQEIASLMAFLQANPPQQ